jgi:Tfp pilus assembly protein PilZ
MENNNNTSSIAEVQTRIFQIISTMPEAHKRKLLTALEKWQSKFDDKQRSKLKDKREHSRKPISLYAICETNCCNFRDFTKDVSAGGAFIETKTNLSLDEGLFMTLFHKSLETPVRATGKVVRVDPKGVGIKFIKPIPGMYLL